jgi:uncharacterized protein YjbI with pentapeptide repeats
VSNLKLVKFEEVTPTLLRVAYFDGHLAELISHLNLPIYGAYDGLDEMVFAFLTLPSGRTVTLGEYANSPRTGVDLYVDSKMDGIPAAIYESCQQVRIPKSQVVWFRDKFQAEIDHLFAEQESIQEIEKSNKDQEVIYNPIDCFRHALEIYDRAEFPEYWAVLQYNLGTVYYDAFKSHNGDRGRNLKWAIDHYRQSEEIFTQDKNPKRWEISQNSLLIVKSLLHEDLVTSDLSGADLNGADFSRADLRGADLIAAKLSGAKFSGANLSSANLSKANLSGASLIAVNLKGANLQGASLILADLMEADLSQANFMRTELSGANFRNSIVIGTRFRYARGISDTLRQELKRRGAIFDDQPPVDSRSIIYSRS